jgi:phosphate starvation-inducible membrane PsiE
VVIAFAVRLAGTGLLLWANTVSIAAGAPLDFHSMPASTGIYLLIAVGLRLGVLPLHLPYRKDNVVRRGFGTSLRLVSASASLILLARIPPSASQSPLTPYLLLIAAITALYAGWMWLRSSDEIMGRPFWVLGLESLAIAASLRGNPIGSAGWGVALILCGGLLFLYSSRQRRINWIPWLGLWGISTLPFSINAAGWQAGNHFSWLFSLPFLPAQALLMTGFLRHTLHPGETSLESQEKWVKIIYPGGLSLLVGMTILLGLWGWDGVRALGVWWWAIAVLLLAAGFFLLSIKFPARIFTGNISVQWTEISPIGRLYSFIFSIYEFLERIARIITSYLEGEGGLLWSLLLLVLIISILSTQGQ